MYPEFIPIYAGLVVIIVLLVVILCVLIKRTSKKSNSSTQSWVSSTGSFQGDQGTIVFCKNCATKFNSLQRICPKCGTSR